MYSEMVPMILEDTVYKCGKCQNMSVKWEMNSRGKDLRGSEWKIYYDYTCTNPECKSKIIIPEEEVVVLKEGDEISF